MRAKSDFLQSLNKDERKALEKRLHERQSGKCFICDEEISLVLHEGQLDIDHIEPKSEGGADEENNFAITHGSCNRSKQASDLRVARRMAEFDRLQREAHEKGDRGANLGHLLDRYGGGRCPLRIVLEGEQAKFSLGETGNNSIQAIPLHQDRLSGMKYFFAVLPLEYLHHDDRINPRSIGPNIRGLIEEFMKKRPQLHVSLAWWAPDAEGKGQVKVFDGQHKAAAQILLGVKILPIRVFVDPDLNLLLHTNTNAGGKLRQVAFDSAVMRHLGSTIFAERVAQYQKMKGLSKEEYHFSEQDLVSFFKGEHREMLRYIIDAARDNISHNKDNKLVEFISWAGKSAERPLAYTAVEKTFFKEFLFKNALSTPMDEGHDQGNNPRIIERKQLVRLMSLFAEIFFIKHWDSEVGGRRLENRLQKGDPVPENHLRAWRVSREEILGNILTWTRLVIENYFAYTGRMVEKDRLMLTEFPEELWRRIEAVLRNISKLPCWIDKELSKTVFGAKQNQDYWKTIFTTGKSPSGVVVLAKKLDLNTMIQEEIPPRGEDE